MRYEIYPRSLTEADGSIQAANATCVQASIAAGGARSQVALDATNTAG